MGDEGPEERQGARYARVEAALQWPMMGLTLVFLVALVLPLQGGLSSELLTAAETAETAVWIAFALEYALLLSLAADRRLFVRTHLLDLVVVTFPALRIFRLARMARLLRLVLLISASTKGVRRASEVFVRYRLGYILAIMLLVLLLVTGLMLAAENQVNPNLNTYPRCLWWGVVTMTTVGYGDAAPVTLAGRVLAMVFMLVGIGLAGVVTATIASVFVGIEGREEHQELTDKLERIEKSLSDLQAQVALLTQQSTDRPKAS